MSEQSPESTKVDRPDKSALFMNFHRSGWCFLTLARVGYFLSGSGVEKFSAATDVPEWAAVVLAVALVVVAFAMTIEGFLRPPGRFILIACPFIAFGLNFNWADGEQVQAVAGLIVISVVVEILFYRCVSKDSTPPQVEELSN